MKNIKNRFNIILASLLLIIVVTGCETTDLDLTNDPSRITTDSADPNLLFNNAQLQFANAFAFNEGNEDGLNVRASETMRMQHLFGPYAGPFSLTAGNINTNLWTSFYRETLKDIETLLPIAESRQLLGLAGTAKIIKAYSYVALVDTWGDVPFTEASNAADFPSPRVDSGQLIYNAMLELLDEAIANIGSPDSIMPQTDLFYGGDRAKWITLARTLKFKMYNQMRLIGDFSSEINALLSAGIIDSADEDFQFQYSSVSSPTDSRHPYYAVSYDADGTGDYMNNYYMDQFLDAKGFPDPRLRYYFYRQTNEDPTGDDLPCEGLPGFNFCYLRDGYIGRDHGGRLGVPPDNQERTTYGLYPVGGAFDSDQFVAAAAGAGAGGAGIFPFMLSSYSKFLQAESALMSGTTGDPKALFLEAVGDSFEKVRNFSPGQVPAAFAMTDADVAAYVTFVEGQYDAATSNEERLDVIMKEYYLALWGNGYEAWNNYRRTSYPSDLSNHVTVPGLFPRTFMYPAAEVNSNPSINQKTIDVRTFWDTNPDNLD